MSGLRSLALVAGILLGAAAVTIVPSCSSDTETCYPASDGVYVPIPCKLNCDPSYPDEVLTVSRGGTVVVDTYTRDGHAVRVEYRYRWAPDASGP
jgi:hypothetical protein